MFVTILFTVSAEAQAPTCTLSLVPYNMFLYKRFRGFFFLSRFSYLLDPPVTAKYICVH